MLELVRVWTPTTATGPPPTPRRMVRHSGRFAKGRQCGTEALQSTRRMSSPHLQAVPPSSAKRQELPVVISRQSHVSCPHKVSMKGPRVSMKCREMSMKAVEC